MIQITYSIRFLTTFYSWVFILFTSNFFFLISWATRHFHFTANNVTLTLSQKMIPKTAEKNLYSDLHLNFPHNVTPESNIKVKTIKEEILIFRQIRFTSTLGNI